MQELRDNIHEFSHKIPINIPNFPKYTNGSLDSWFRFNFKHYSNNTKLHFKTR